MISALLFAGLAMQVGQNPSPIPEATRTHDRVVQRNIATGRRKGRVLTVGHPGPASPVILHFHGDTWLPEQEIAGVYPDVTIVSLYLGSISDFYQDAYKTPQSFQALLTEAGAGRRPVYLSAFSAGYGAVRAILKHSYRRIDTVLLMDGLHSDYLGKEIDPAGLDVFLQFARDASLGRKRMLITHSEVYPGTFPSTRETTDWLLNQLKLKRMPVLRSGPVGMQQLSDARKGRLVVMGFAGDSPLDHVDHLHGMSAWLRTLRRI